jgi:hypothetical protein
MNQEKVKELLGGLYGCKEDYRVIFSGRKNGKVNGLYKPDSREIVIHNLNFTVDDTLMYTAIHELAHHVMYTEYGFHGARSHTGQFWATFHELLDKARAEGIYAARLDGETQAALDEARQVSREIAGLQRRLGRLLTKVHEGCEKQGLRAQDFIENEAQISQKTERKAIAAAALNLPENIGADIQEAVLGERDGGARAAMIAAAGEGMRVARVKQAAKGPPEKAGETEALETEKARLEKSIRSLTRRLFEVERRIEEQALSKRTKQRLKNLLKRETD